MGIGPKTIRLFPDEKPHQTVRHIHFHLAPFGAEVIVESDLDSDDKPEASAQIAHVRGTDNQERLWEIISALLKILRGHFNMKVQIDCEGSVFYLNQSP